MSCSYFNFWSTISLTLALFIIFIVLVQKRIVLMDSSTWTFAGEIQPMIVVTEFPPNAFFSRNVSFESLYETWAYLHASWLTTTPRLNKL